MAVRQVSAATSRGRRSCVRAVLLGPCGQRGHRQEQSVLDRRRWLVPDRARPKLVTSPKTAMVLGGLKRCFRLHATAYAHERTSWDHSPAAILENSRYSLVAQSCNAAGVGAGRVPPDREAGITTTTFGLLHVASSQCRWRHKERGTKARPNDDKRSLHGLCPRSIVWIFQMWTQHGSAPNG